MDEDPQGSFGGFNTVDGTARGIKLIWQCSLDPGRRYNLYGGVLSEIFC